MKNGQIISMKLINIIFKHFWFEQYEKPCFFKDIEWLVANISVSERMAGKMDRVTAKKRKILSSVVTSLYLRGW
jgi:hypothetical protein